MIAALLAGLLIAAPDPGAEGEMPVRAKVERRGDAFHIRVIGKSRTPVSVRYTLQTRIGGNVTAQSGEARLDGGAAHTLIDLTQSASTEPGQATLTVIIGDRRYDQVLTL